MKFNFKKAGEILGNMLTSNPQIPQEMRDNLHAALDADAQEAVAEQAAKVADLETQLAASNAAKETAETALATATAEFSKEKEALGWQVIKLTEEKTALEAKVAEYEPIKDQLENYRSQVGSVQPEGEGKPAGTGKNARQQEIDRLKAEYPISTAFLS